MITISDINRLRAQFGLGDKSMEYLMDKPVRLPPNRKTFVTRPLNGETTHRLKECHVVEFKGGRATVIVNDQRTTVDQEDVLIERRGR